jgi:molybdopterin converting factor subunit 1
MIVRVHLFARARDVFGGDAVTVQIAEGGTVAELCAALRRERPQLAGLLERSALAVNAEFAGPGHRLNAGDEIALLPPVSGG